MTATGLKTYESGVDPVGAGWAQSQIRYISFAFLYVVFAVDAVYLFPWALVLRDPDLGVASLVEVVVFVGVILVGLLHAARRGLLRWDLHERRPPMPRVGPVGEHAPKPIRVVLNWGRRYSLWVFNFGLACCAIEFIATSMGRHDFIRLGVIPFAPGPRQADLMVVSGTVTDKMAPAIRRLYDQMPEPKYVISFGACSNSGGPYWDSYSVTKGVDQLIPVDVYVPGCPPAPEALLQGIIRLQEKIADERVSGAGIAARQPGSAAGHDRAVCRSPHRRRGRGDPRARDQAVSDEPRERPDPRATAPSSSPPPASSRSPWSRSSSSSRSSAGSGPSPSERPAVAGPAGWPPSPRRGSSSLVWGLFMAPKGRLRLGTGARVLLSGRAVRGHGLRAHRRGLAVLGMVRRSGRARRRRRAGRPPDGRRPPTGG